LLRTIRVPTGPGNEGKVWAVAMSPDGAMIAAGGWTGGSGKGSIYLFERATGRMIGRIGGLEDVVFHLAFSPDGSKLGAALGGANGVRLFETKSWQKIASDTDYGDTSYWLSFARDGRIATTSDDGKIRLYGPMLDGRQTIAAPDGKHPFGIAFSPDGSRLAVGYDDKAKVSLLDSRSLKRLPSPDTAGVWRSGLKLSDLREAIAALADKGKVLVFFDACHSGNLASGARDGGQVDIDKAASALGNADTGAIVFSSSTGKEFSVERADLGHGVFTYALLEALDGKSNRPPPWLYVSDLEIWLSDEVNKLTKGAQTPKTTVPGERFTNPRVFMIQAR
jgi:WD40 repeat protein